MPLWYGGQELRTLVGLTSLRTKNPPMLPKLNRRRAMFVLTKIDEILAWEKQKEAERDTRCVELGRYLCEVRADILAGGKREVLRRVPGKAFPGVEAQGLLLDVDP